MPRQGRSTRTALSPISNFSLNNEAANIKRSLVLKPARKPSDTLSQWLGSLFIYASIVVVCAFLTCTSVILNNLLYFGAITGLFGPRPLYILLTFIIF
ncbi:uncharacterized protein NEMAJ01_2313, partial [Nematocida major]|uniref:uncharacterized protein n=1 Tax=Nematocida major TaxID=1912982 RepID=UPI002008C709